MASRRLITLTTLAAGVVLASLSGCAGGSAGPSSEGAKPAVESATLTEPGTKSWDDIETAITASYTMMANSEFEELCQYSAGVYVQSSAGVATCASDMEAWQTEYDAKVAMTQHKDGWEIASTNIDNDDEALRESGDITVVSKADEAGAKQADQERKTAGDSRYFYVVFQNDFGFNYNIAYTYVDGKGWQVSDTIG
jgi:hypothetical protein